MPYVSPDRLLEELGIDSPEDIDLEAIGYHCNAIVVYRNLGGCEARILGAGDRAIITVDEQAHEYRRRFSIGHELGHWILDRGKVAFTCTELMMTSEWAGNNPERRANQFSADLLLPQRLFKPDAHGREITFSTVRSLAKRYRTSLVSTAIRLVELGSEPSLIILSRLGKRWKWFKRWPDLPSSIWPLEQPGPETVAHDLLRGSDEISEPVEVPVSNWIERAAGSRFTIIEDSLRVGEDQVLSLLWWKDERHLLGLL